MRWARRRRLPETDTDASVRRRHNKQKPRLRVSAEPGQTAGETASWLSVIDFPSLPSPSPAVAVPEGYHIEIDFLDYFEIEESPKCENDFLLVSDTSCCTRPAI